MESQMLIFHPPAAFQHHTGEFGASGFLKFHFLNITLWQNEVVVVKSFVWGLTRGRHTPHALSVGQPTSSNLESIPFWLLFLKIKQVLLAEGWSLGHSICCHTLHLLSEFWQFVLRAPETGARPTPSSQWRPFLTTRRVTWLPILHPACHCLPNHPLVLSSWQTVYGRQFLYLGLKYIRSTLKKLASLSKPQTQMTNSY